MYAAGGLYNEINVINISDDSLVKNLKPHKLVHSLLFSHTSDFLISGSSDSSI
jgi:WD40 repeat protein